MRRSHCRKACKVSCECLNIRMYPARVHFSVWCDGRCDEKEGKHAYDLTMLLQGQGNCMIQIQTTKYTLVVVAHNLQTSAAVYAWRNVDVSVSPCLPSNGFAQRVFSHYHLAHDQPCACARPSTRLSHLTSTVLHCTIGNANEMIVVLLSVPNHRPVQTCQRSERNTN